MKLYFTFPFVPHLQSTYSFLLLLHSISHPLSLLSLLLSSCIFLVIYTGSSKLLPCMTLV